MNTRTKDFHQAVLTWYNKSLLANSHGYAETIDQVTTATKLCPDETCQWEQLILVGRRHDGEALRVVLNNADIFDFFRQLEETK